MGNRLSRIVTRTGDEGSTGLADGRRVAKDHARIEAIGAVDELNCALGVLLAHESLSNAVRACLTEVQHELFDLGGELAIPGTSTLGVGQVERLESALEQFNAELPPLKEFVLPGGNGAAAACHMARTIARRAERRCWSLHRAEPLNAHALRYLNRLSDLLFVLARVLARAQGGAETMWSPRR